MTPIQTAAGRGVCCAACRAIALLEPGDGFWADLRAFGAAHRDCVAAVIPAPRSPRAAEQPLEGEV